MSNGEAMNCILQICCPENSQASVEALASHIQQHNPHWGLQAPQAEAVAKYVLDTFDLAPKGTLGPLKAEIARLARQ